MFLNRDEVRSLAPIEVVMLPEALIMKRLQQALLNKGDEMLKELQNYDESNKDEIAKNIPLKNKLKRFSKKFLETVKTTKTIVLDAPKVAGFFTEKIGDLLEFATSLNDPTLIDTLEQINDVFIKGQPLVG